MNYSNFKTDWNKPSKFIAEHYGTKITVEYDHSDLNFDEVMDAFETLVVGMGYHKDTWKEWILDRADEYREEDAEEKINEPYTYEQFKKDEEFANLRHGYEDREELEDEFFGKLDSEDYEGQFEDWKNETPDEFEDADGGFQSPPPNEQLKKAKKEYDKSVKKRKPKSTKDWEDEYELGGNE